jgi:cbb3-type cytochrome oxidase subunit 3
MMTVNGLQISILGISTVTNTEIISARKRITEEVSMWHDVAMMALGMVALVALVILVLFGLAWWAHAAEKRDNLEKAQRLKLEREEKAYHDAVARIIGLAEGWR